MRPVEPENETSAFVGNKDAGESVEQDRRNEKRKISRTARKILVGKKLSIKGKEEGAHSS